VLRRGAFVLEGLGMREVILLSLTLILKGGEAM
jgi:hypothetical protein